MEQLRRELLDEKKHKRKLEKILADCAKALKTALTVKSLFSSFWFFTCFDVHINICLEYEHCFQESTTEDVEETPYEQMEKRDNMLENLLVLLNSAASLGLGPLAGDLGKTKEQERIVRPRTDSKMPGSGKGIRRG